MTKLKSSDLPRLRRLEYKLADAQNETTALSSWALMCCLCGQWFYSTDASRTRCYMCEGRISRPSNHNETEEFYGYGTNELDEE